MNQVFTINTKSELFSSINDMGKTKYSVTRPLNDWIGGDQSVLNQLISLVHQELYHLAHCLMFRKTHRTFWLSDEVLARLARFDTRKSRAVELRYSGGFSIEKAATVLINLR